VFNRVNVVLWAMDLREPMPQNAPAPYAPSLVEWGITVGLIAAAIFLLDSERACSRCCPRKTLSRRGRVTLDVWLAQHPYLEPFARLDAEVQREINGVSLDAACIPSWDRYFADYVAGVPLLESQVDPIDLAPVEKALKLVVGNLAMRPLEGALRKEPDALEAELCSTEDVSPASAG